MPTLLRLGDDIARTCAKWAVLDTPMSAVTEDILLRRMIHALYASILPGTLHITWFNKYEMRIFDKDELMPDGGE